ncbi:MAG: hypothetical protein ABIC91_00540 [Nanoarchaeota archaeon]|nr:hypothetical protein [Nanoarchaeota archaeon]MBU1029748.1 hypothetical protein [Nanoarchaeota archaeon]
MDKQIKFSELQTISGYSADQVISALQKEIRRGNFENACFFCMELLDSGNIFINKFWERMSVIVVEDVSDVHAINTVRNLKETYFDLENSKKWDKDMQAIKAVQILCEAKKDRIVSEIYDYMKIKRKEGLKIKIPKYAIDMHTKQGKKEKKDYLHFLQISSKINNPIKNKNKKYLNELINYAKRKIFP